jgi:hypothetical protein
MASSTGFGINFTHFIVVHKVPSIGDLVTMWSDLRMNKLLRLMLTEDQSYFLLYFFLLDTENPNISQPTAYDRECSPGNVL